ncbi:hypothetical protein Lser_V15G26651 [Lactuca serriola]
MKLVQSPDGRKWLYGEVHGKILKSVYWVRTIIIS